MFENLLRQLQETTQISVPISVDEKGYIDRQCPNTDCEFLFKVNEDDWRNIQSTQEVWCPMCGHTAGRESWYTIEQINGATTEAATVMQGRINQSIRKDAEQFNRKKSPDSFVSMSMKFTGSTGRTHVIPLAASEAMQLEIRCEECSSRFAVIGSAYFCPSCGFNSVERMFHDSLRKITAKKNTIDRIRADIGSPDMRDEVEITCRSLIESCLLDGVTAFQKYSEELYKQKTGKSAKRNVFQRLEDGSKHLHDAAGVGYDQIINAEQLSQLTVFFQKRHLLAHSDGIVDESYLTKSMDTSYKVGQRIVVSRSEVDTFVEILTQLSEGIKAVCA